MLLGQKFKGVHYFGFNCIFIIYYFENLPWGSLVTYVIPPHHGCVHHGRLQNVSNLLMKERERLKAFSIDVPHQIKL